MTDSPGTLAIEGVDGRDLYYVAAVDRPSALWRLPLGEGPPAKVLDGVVLGNFAVTQDGIYYIDRMTGEAGVFYSDRPGGETRSRYFDFGTGRTTTVAGDLGAVGSGLSASRDGRTVFFSRVDASADELMLVDDFQ